MSSSSDSRTKLAAANRNSRLTARALTSAKSEFDGLGAQIDVVVISTAVIRAAGVPKMRDCAATTSSTPS